MLLQSKKYPVSEDLLSISQEQIAQLDQEISDGQGWQFYNNGFISGATVFQDTIIGRVRELSSVSTVEIKVHGNNIYVSCNCSTSNEICVHAVALLYSWVNDAESFLNVGKSLDELERLDKEELVGIIRKILVRDPKYLQLMLGRDAADDDHLLDDGTFFLPDDLDE